METEKIRDPWLGDMETEKIRYSEDKIFATVNLIRNKGYLTADIGMINKGSHSVPCYLDGFVNDGRLFAHKDIGIVIPIDETFFRGLKRRLFRSHVSPYVSIAIAERSHSYSDYIDLEVYGRRYVPHMQNIALQLINIGWKDVHIQLKSEKTPQLLWRK